MAAVSQSLYGLEGERWENLSIQKSGGSYIFRSGFKTSRFAVASVDWPVPDNARLDDYYVETWLDYLAKRSEALDEPYLLASYALAAMDMGEKAGAEKAVAKLRTFAREDAGTSYWHPESNTPFYGWGLAGRIETTALAVKALCSE